VAVLVALTVGLVWWVVAWSFGIKAFDAFMLTAAIVVVAAAAHIVKPYIDRLMGRGAASGVERGAGF
jgi:hypothetical protein